MTLCGLCLFVFVSFVLVAVILCSNLSPPPFLPASALGRGQHSTVHVEAKCRCCTAHCVLRCAFVGRITRSCLILRVSCLVLCSVLSHFTTKTETDTKTNCLSFPLCCLCLRIAGGIDTEYPSGTRRRRYYRYQCASQLLRSAESQR
jgi:hypothetical protein